MLKTFSFSLTEQSVWTICHQLCQRKAAANLHWTHTQNGASRFGSSALFNTKRNKKNKLSKLFNNIEIFLELRDRSESNLFLPCTISSPLWALRGRKLQDLCVLFSSGASLKMFVKLHFRRNMYKKGSRGRKSSISIIKQSASLSRVRYIHVLDRPQNVITLPGIKSCRRIFTDVIVISIRLCVEKVSCPDKRWLQTIKELVKLNHWRDFQPFGCSIEEGVRLQKRKHFWVAKGLTSPYILCKMLSF